MESLFEQRKGNEMTFLEKAKEIEEEEANGLSEYGIISGMCPHHYGLESKNKSCTEDSEKCRACWNREMPNTEAKGIEVIPQEIVEASQNGWVDGYSKGLNDAWEVVRKIFCTDCADLQKVFGHSDEGVVIMTFTPQEALAKLKAYEEAQIEVGDVVTYSGERGMVLDSIPSKFVVLTHDGWVQEWYECDVEKTGKHIDIQSILESIGE